MKSKSEVVIEESLKSKIYLSTWVQPKTVCEPYPDPKNNPIGPQKIKNDPKINSKSKVKIERTIENKSCLNIWVDPKTVFEPYPDSQN